MNEIIPTIVSDKNQWGLVTTSDEFYKINFKTYATVEEGCTYIGIVTNPMFMEKYIDHLTLVDRCGDK